MERTGPRDHFLFPEDEEGRRTAHIGYLEPSLFVSMRILASLVALALVAFSPAVQAEKGAPLAVERGAGAERCPDADLLSARIEIIRGRPATGAPTAYLVTFTRRDDGFLATIRGDAKSGSMRTLEHDGAQCSALGHAVALTLALLFDADVEPPQEPPPKAPAPSTVATPIAPPPPPPRPSREATVSLGPSALVGVVRPLAGAFAAQAGMGFSSFRIGLGVLFAWPQAISLGPGEVHQGLLAGFARACLPLWQREGLRFDACSGAVAGAVTAEAEGYTRNEARYRTLLALPLEAALAGGSSPAGWELSVAGLLPLRRPDFTIDGMGTAYRSPPIGAMLSLRLVGIIPF